MLTFAIPTYNRVEKLKICLDSICSQIEHKDGFFVTVCNNKSTDSTALLLEEYGRKYSFLSFKNLSHHTSVQDQNGSWFGSVAMASTDWIWTFGDDDILLENGLDIVLDALNNYPDLTFLHATQNGRCSGSGKLYKPDNLLQLCQTFGWIDTCGFISSNICRGELLKMAYKNYSNVEYNKGVFAAAACILEQFASSPAALLDIPIVGLQDEEMTEDTKRRWFEKEDHFNRYFFTIDALKEVLNRQTFIPKTLSPKFFRYHGFHIWERHLQDLAKLYEQQHELIGLKYFEIVQGWAHMVSDGITKKHILASVMSLQDAIGSLEAMKQRLVVLQNINDAGIYGFKNIDTGIVDPAIIKEPSTAKTNERLSK